MHARGRRRGGVIHRRRRALEDGPPGWYPRALLPPFVASKRALSLLAIGALLVAVFGANVYVALQGIDVLEGSFNNEERPAEVQRTLISLLSALQDAETGQRGYLLTGEQPYLEPYTDARAQADSLLTRLEDLVSWNPLQVSRMPGLRAAVDDEFEWLASSIATRDEVGPETAVARLRAGEGRRTMDEVRARIQEMLSEAGRVRALYSSRADTARARVRRSVWVSSAALGALLLAFVWALRANVRRRDLEAERLAQANDALSLALGEREAALQRVGAMQAQLVQQEKLAGMGRLTAGVAHELKNPLNFVTNFASLTGDLADEAAQALEDGDLEAAREALAAVHQNAGKIVSHGRRADDIVQSMLVHARGVGGERQAAEVGAVVRSAVDQAVGPRGEGDVAVEVVLEDGLPEVEVAAGSVTRLVRNLVENALYAVRERAGAGAPAYRPRVTVSARRGRDHDGREAVVVTVADNGSGIPDDLFPRIFEPFFTTKGPGSGTGLGLSLAHDIAVGHGGSLLAERPEAGGAAFVLVLPLHPPATDPEDAA